MEVTRVLVMYKTTQKEMYRETESREKKTKERE